MVNPDLQGKCHPGSRSLNRGVVLSTIKQIYKRYPVAGRVLFLADSMEAAGELVDISRGGVHIRSEIKPLEGEDIDVRFTVQDYPEVFQVRGIVVRVHSDSWAVLFLDEPAGLTRLMRSLYEKAQKQAASPIGT